MTDAEFDPEMLDPVAKISHAEGLIRAEHRVLDDSWLFWGKLADHLNDIAHVPEKTANRPSDWRQFNRAQDMAAGYIRMSAAKPEAAPAPLTCERCRSAPAARLVVVDLPVGERFKSLACLRCASAHTREAACLGWPAWQSALGPAAEEAARPPHPVTFDLSDADVLHVLVTALEDYADNAREQTRCEDASESFTRWAGVAERMKDQAEAAAG